MVFSLSLFQQVNTQRKAIVQLILEKRELLVGQRVKRDGTANQNTNIIQKFVLFSCLDHHRHNLLTHCTLLFFWEEHLTQTLASLGPHATLVGSSGPTGTIPLLKVDTGKSRQLDDCFRNYRSDRNGLGAQKTSWRGSEALLHAFGQ